MITTFICSTKDFNYDKSINNNCKLICTDNVQGTYPYNMQILTDGKYYKLKKHFNEVFCIYEIFSNNLNNDNFDPDIISVCPSNAHIDITEEYISDNEVILPTPIMNNMEYRFSKSHNIKDLRLCEQIISEMFPEYAQPYKQINGVYPYNIFVMNKKDFDAYCNFVFPVLDEFCKRKVFYLDEDIDIHVSMNTNLYPGGINGQQNMIAALLENINTIFFMHYFKNYTVKHKEVILNN